MADITLYGIPTCDTCRKAQKALSADGHAVAFRDVRAEPLTGEERTLFASEFGDAVINKRSTTYRGIAEAERSEAPEQLLASHPTVMKRPVLRSDARLTLGWSDEIRASWR